MRAATAASLISPNARSATPLYFGLSASVFYTMLTAKFPESSSENSLPLSDRTAMTADGVPSARTSARNDSNALAASD